MATSSEVEAKREAPWSGKWGSGVAVSGYVGTGRSADREAGAGGSEEEEDDDNEEEDEGEEEVARPRFACMRLEPDEDGGLDVEAEVTGECLAPATVC
ncbi:hypothetical protein NL676_020144 [Syzygium grande]|nr:hypothetical protein NL676_020144 [Syzygium grande]